MIIYHSIIDPQIIPATHRHQWRLDPRATAMVCQHPDCDLALRFAWPTWEPLFKRLVALAQRPAPTAKGIISISGELQYPCHHLTLVSDFAAPIFILQPCTQCRQNCPACHGTGRRDKTPPVPRDQIAYTRTERQAYVQYLRTAPCPACRGEGATRKYRATGRLSWRTFIADDEPPAPTYDSPYACYTRGLTPTPRPRTAIMTTDEHLSQILDALEAEFGAYVLIARTADGHIGVAASFEGDHDHTLRRSALLALRTASADWDQLPEDIARA